MVKLGFTPIRLANSRDLSSASLGVRVSGCESQSAPWQCLNFLPDPHGHSALRLTV